MLLRVIIVPQSFFVAFAFFAGMQVAEMDICGALYAKLVLSQVVCYFLSSLLTFFYFQNILHCFLKELASIGKTSGRFMQDIRSILAENGQPLMSQHILTWPQ